VVRNIKKTTQYLLIAASLSKSNIGFKSIYHSPIDYI